MKRREFITLLGGAAACPVVSHAQQLSLPVIGYLDSQSPGVFADILLRPFWQGLKDLGYAERENVAIEYRWADNQIDRLPELAAELVRLKVDVIVTHGIPGILAAKQATATIPIVMAVSGDAVASGLVSSIARPGGNVTGLTFFTPELAVKRLELLKENVPGLAEVGVLVNPANPISEPILPAMKVAAQSLKLELAQFAVRGPAEFEGSFAAMATRRVGAHEERWRHVEAERLGSLQVDDEVELCRLLYW